MEKKNVEYQSGILSESCVCCGAPIPEGRMVCKKCEKSYDGLYLPFHELQKQKRSKRRGKRT